LTGSFDYYDDDGDSQSDNQTRWYLNNSEKSYGEDDTEDSCWRTCGPSSSDCKLYGNLIDEDWSTYIDVSSCFLSNNTFFINYTVPTGITKGNWSIKYDSRYGDVSGFCYNGSWQDLDFEATSGAETKSKRILDTCINYGSVLELKIIGSDYHDDIYEEKVLWQLDNSTNVDKRFTTKGQNWTFSARTNDGYDWGNWSNSSQLTIENSAPSKVILISPTNNNGSLINRTPTFIWNAATDNDNLLAYNEPPISSDTIRYEINITRDTFTGEPDCSTDSKYATGISATNYTIDVELCVDDVYNWTVRAADGTENGEWSDVWNFTVMSYVSIVFVNSSVDFGSLQITQEKNTTGDDPYPLVVENSGNVVVNLTLHANSSLWSRSYAGLNTIYFQYMADNTSETNSFNWSLSQTSFTNLSSVGINLIKALSYNNSKDTAEIELKVVVPPDEPSGSKVTGLVVTATY